MSIEHDWDDGKRFGYQVCRKCCVVKRIDGKNKPCRPARLREMELGLVDEDGHITPVDTSVLNELMMKPATDSPPTDAGEQVRELRELASISESPAGGACRDEAALLRSAAATIERLYGELKTIRDAREANLGPCDYCGGTIWGVNGFVEMENLRLHPLCVERRSVNRLASNLAQTEASLTLATADLAAAKAERDELDALRIELLDSNQSLSKSFAACIEERDAAVKVIEVIRDYDADDVWAKEYARDFLAGREAKR